MKILAIIMPMIIIRVITLLMVINKTITLVMIEEKIMKEIFKMKIDKTFEVKYPFIAI